MRKVFNELSASDRQSLLFGYWKYKGSIDTENYIPLSFWEWLYNPI